MTSDYASGGPTVNLPTEILSEIWRGDYTRPVAAELDPAFVAMPFTPPAPTFFPPIADRIDEVMRARLTDMYGTL